MEADDWTLAEREFDITTAQAYETLFTQGSGYLHVRGSLDEHLLDAPQNTTYMRMPANVTAEKFPETGVKWGTYVPGVFGVHPFLNREMLNLPHFLSLTPYVDGEKLDMQRSQISDYRRALDLRTAVLRRSLTWATQSGAVVRVLFERFVSAAHPAVCVQRMTLEANTTAAVRIVSRIDTDVRTSGYDFFEDVALAAGDGTLACRVTTTDHDAVDIAAVMLGGGPWQASQDDRQVTLETTLHLEPGVPLVIEKRCAVATSRDLAKQSAADALDRIAAQSYDALLAQHAAIWEKHWEKADIAIEGDAMSQLAVRVAIYHLLRVRVDDPRVAVDAKGYAGDAYFGRFFWDTEMYLLPFYLYTDPSHARRLVEYRIQSLDGARRNARRYGYPGARYAWEADDRGDESCPSWQYSDHEVHVTADVIYGLMHYLHAAGDRTLLDEGGAEMLAETARYWRARVDWRPGEAHPSLLGVMGPDEYTPISHNNSYTNRLVRFALDAAAQWSAADADEKQAFAAIARALPIPTAEDGTLVLQSEDFPMLAEPEFDRLWPDRSQPFAAQVSQERLYRTKCLKQADVLLLMVLFPDEFTPAQKRRAWDYYLPYTTHDSSLSPSIHAIFASALGLHDSAWNFWQQTALLDLDVAGGAARQGMHIANCGAIWQVILFGFCGIRTALQSDVFRLTPRLPRQWQTLAFSFTWQGCPLRIAVTQTDTRIENTGARGLDVEIDGQPGHVPPGAAVRFAHRA